MALVETVNGTQMAQLTAGEASPAGYLATVGASASGGESTAVLGAERLLVSPHAYAPEGEAFQMQRLYDLLAGSRAPRVVALSEQRGVTAQVGACGVVTVCVDGTKAIPAGAQWTEVALGTLPEGMHPAAEVNSGVQCGGASGILSVLPDGRVKYVRAAPSSYAEGLAAAVTFCAA